MTRKNFADLITQDTEASAVPAEAAGDRSFDFNQPVETMDADTLSVYYRLRRVALMANDGRGDPGRLPDGKHITEAEVIETLGPDYATGLIIDKKCCG